MESISEYTRARRVGAKETSEAKSGIIYDLLAFRSQTESLITKGPNQEADSSMDCEKVSAL